MTTLNSLLFLGLPIDESFAILLKKNKPEYISLFINSNNIYLEEINFQEVRYLGKYVKNEESLTQLKLLEANIYSLLKKLAANYDYSKSNLVLFVHPHTPPIHFS